jgi:hypothetical protein
MGVATLALGSRPRQGVTRLRESRGKKPGSQKEGSPRAKAKALEGCGPRGSPRVITYSRESEEVRGSVTEWAPTLPRQLPFWERESRWTSETSECELKGQISMDCCALGTVGKLLKRRCLKWARIAHLDIWKASYGQKKGRESNWQFDSRPLKVGSTFFRHPIWECDTALESSRRGLQLCFRPRRNRTLQSGDIGANLGQFRDSHAGIPGKKEKVYTIRGKVVASPKSRPWWVLCVRVARGSS